MLQQSLEVRGFPGHRRARQGEEVSGTPSAPLPTPDPIPEHGGLALDAVGLVHDDPGRLDGELDHSGGPAAVGGDGEGRIDTLQGGRVRQ